MRSVHPFGLMSSSASINLNMIDVDIGIIKNHMQYQLAVNEPYVPNNETINLLTDPLNSSIVAQILNIESYPVTHNEVYATYTKIPTDTVYQSYTTSILTRIGRTFWTSLNHSSTPTGAYEGWIKGSVIIPTGDLFSDYYVVGYITTDTDYAGGVGDTVDGYQSYVTRRGWEIGIGSPTDGAPDFGYGQYVQVDNNGEWALFFPGQIVGNLAVRLFKKVGSVYTQYGDAWRENQDDSYYSGLVGELYSVTDAEYFTNSDKIRVFGGTGKLDFSAVPYSPIVKLIKLRNTNTNNIVAFWSTPTGTVRSYNFSMADPAYNAFRNRGYTYDSAICLLALISQNISEYAEKTALSLVECQLPNGSFPFSIHIISHVGDPYIRTGAVAWVCYALSTFCISNSVASGPIYNAVVKAADWLVSMKSTSGLQSGSVLGGFGLYGPPPTYTFDGGYQIPWCSTEHNIDTWFALRSVYQLTGIATYMTAADGIANNLMTNHWNSIGGYFYQGISDASTIDTASALDCMTWATYFLLATNQRQKAHTSMRRASKLYINTVGGITGYTPYFVGDGYPSATPLVWPEGTYGAAIAHHRLNQPQHWAYFINQMDKLRLPSGELPYANAKNTTYEITDYPGIIGVAWDVIARNPNTTVFS